MAICQIFDNPALDAEQWERLAAHLRATGPTPAEGARLVLAGPADGGWRVITVWDSDEVRDRFFEERLRPAYADAGLPLEDTERTVFEVHALIAGDLTGTPQPA